MESAEEVLARWRAAAGARVRPFAATAVVAASRVKVLAAVGFATARAALPRRLRVRPPR